MNAFFIPGSSGSNPYLRSLKDALSIEGVRVETAVYDPDWIDSLNRGSSVLHFHWPSVFCKLRRVDEVEGHLGKWSRYLGKATERGIPIVWTVHNLYPHDMCFRESERKARTLLLKHASHLIFHCHAAAELLSTEFGNLPPHTVQPHPHYRSQYPSAMERTRARKYLDIRLESFVVLCYGMLRAYKGIDLLVEAMDRLEDVAWELVIAGKPQGTFDLCNLRRRAQADPRLHLLARHIGKRYTSMLFGACDVVALPYHNILTSGTVVLSQSMGRSVIVPRMGCISEMVPVAAGITYDPKCSNGLSEALIASIKSDRISMGQDGLSRVKDYGWADSARGTKLIYEEIQRANNI